MRFLKTYLFATLSLIAIQAKAAPPEGVVPIENFELERYTGLWYEIARTDNRFERNLEQVSAEYSIIDENTIRVVNRGYNSIKSKWNTTNGKAKFNDSKDVGSLKVTFFWPFYGGYYIFDIDRENYDYALVSGGNHSYFWILARKPNMPVQQLNKLLEKARIAGFPVDELIFVKHTSPPPPEN